MKYAYIDGDDIGLKIENSFMNNDEGTLSIINQTINNLIQVITKYLHEKGFEIIFSGADGIICKSKNIDINTILSFIKVNSPDINFSIGVGDTLRDAFLALRYAKSTGKNNGVIFSNNIFTAIS